MKKIKTVFTTVVMLLSFSSFASGYKPYKVTPVVKAAFENDFSKATRVNWEKPMIFILHRFY